MLLTISSDALTVVDYGDSLDSDKYIEFDDLADIREKINVLKMLCV